MNIEFMNEHMNSHFCKEVHVGNLFDNQQKMADIPKMYS